MTKIGPQVKKLGLAGYRKATLHGREAVVEGKDLLPRLMLNLCSLVVDCNGFGAVPIEARNVQVGIQRSQSCPVHRCLKAGQIGMSGEEKDALAM